LEPWLVESFDVPVGRVGREDLQVMWRIMDTSGGSGFLRFRALSLCLGLTLGQCAAAPAQSLVVNSLPNQDRSYALDKKVSPFSTNEDFSTPEAAYATTHRVEPGKEGET
jgi:hypothetical protein